MDTFDPTHTPNHVLFPQGLFLLQDDHQLRYSYRLQPTIIWWNLTRLGEALGELMGSISHVDEPTYISGEYTDEQKADVVKHGERIIEAAGEEYKTVFLKDYEQLMAKVRCPFYEVTNYSAWDSRRRWKMIWISSLMYYRCWRIYHATLIIFFTD
jgi:uncharacterized protein YdiU (UPF0061 family)